MRVGGATVVSGHGTSGRSQCALVGEGDVQGGQGEKEGHDIGMAQLAGIVQWRLTNLHNTHTT